MSILIGLYMWNVFFVSYVVYSVERVAGTCMLYSDVIWMTAVTITNLGYGEFTPSSFISRIIISILSVFGIIQTALIVQVVQNYLKIPSDEQRILNFIERTRLLQLRQQAAARLIQCAWRRYKYGRAGIEKIVAVSLKLSLDGHMNEIIKLITYCTWLELLRILFLKIEA